MTGNACATVAPSASTAAPVSIIARMLRCLPWPRDLLSMFIPNPSKKKICGGRRSDDFLLRQGRRPFFAARVDRDDGEEPGARIQRRELERVRSRIRDEDAVIEILR